MSRRTILVLSAALSAFVLVVVGAIATTSLRAASSPSPSPAPSPTASAAETVPVELVRAREAELRRLVDEANARLRAQTAAAETPVAPPRSAGARAERHGEDEGRHGHSRHEGKLANNAHEEDDDG
jgi:hypothetical protein